MIGISVFVGVYVLTGVSECNIEGYFSNGGRSGGVLSSLHEEVCQVVPRVDIRPEECDIFGPVDKWVVRYFCADRSSIIRQSV